MKLEAGYTNLEWSKKLKGLGVRQESGFIWKVWKNSHGEGVELEYNPGIGVNEKAGELCAAFSTAELGVALPWNAFTKRRQTDDSTPWECTFDEGYMKPKRYENDDTEANARAAMLVYLLENKIITVEEVNARLAA